MVLPTHPLDRLPGLSAAHAQALAHLGLTTTAQLRHHGQSMEQRQRLAKALQVPLRYVTKWVILADLARVPAVGCQFNGLLLHAGITSVPLLAASSTQRLYSQLRRLHVATMQRNDLCPTADQVSLWIQQAKALNRGG